MANDPAALSPPSDGGWIELDQDGDGLRIDCGGQWVLRAAGPLDRRLRDVAAKPSFRRVTMDLGRIDSLDTAGAWLIERTARDLEARGLDVSLTNVNDRHKPLLKEVDRVQPDMVVEERRPNKLVEIANHAGKATFEFLDEGKNLIAFFGMLVVKTGRIIVQPRRLRLAPLIFHMEQTGLNAMPIVGLLSFLIGVVLAYQGATQLQQFGAEIFTVNLLGIAVLRELGILMTAIIIAGRSGSAFTAQIGTMKVNQEIDAMETLGLDPVDMLVLPRIIALAVTLPLLGFFASMVALLGGALMANVALDITFTQFLNQLSGAVDLTALMAGMVKAPVFAFVIAMVGCYEGLKVSGSAESVGRQTTQSVVESIFLVIVIDALFSVAFSMIGI